MFAFALFPLKSRTLREKRTRLEGRSSNANSALRSNQSGGGETTKCASVWISLLVFLGPIKSWVAGLERRINDVSEAPGRPQAAAFNVPPLVDGRILTRDLQANLFLRSPRCRGDWLWQFNMHERRVSRFCSVSNRDGRFIPVAQPNN